MRAPFWWTFAALAVAMLARGAAAQEPQPRPEPRPPAPAPPPAPPEPEPPRPEPRPAPPVDAGDVASELLRKALGLDPGPAADTAVPPGPAAVTTEQPAAALPRVPAADGQQPAAPGRQGPEPGREQGQGQEPAPAPPRAREVDDATRALEQLLPGARPAAAAPVVPAAPGPPPPAVEPPLPTVAAPAGDADGGPWFTGSMRARYRLRRGGGDDDQDLVTLLAFDVGDADRHAVTAHAVLRAFGDLDGREPEERFAGLDQSLGDEFDLYAYEAFVDLHRLPGLQRVRLGRQPLDDTPVALAFDGAHVRSPELGPLRVQASAWAGVPTHRFESSARGDEVQGARVALVPARGADLRIDWLRLRDRLVTGPRHADLLAVTGSWSPIEHARLRASHSWQDGQPYEWDAGLTMHAADLGADLQLRWHELLSTRRDEVTELDPFAPIALELRPYRQLEARAGKDLGDHVTVAAGLGVRRLRDASAEGAFNREFERLFAEVTARDALAPGVDLALDAALWNSQGEDTRSVAGSAGYRWSRALEARTGTAYDLYKYDAFAGRERDHVRSWFAELRWRPAAATRVDLDYALERDDAERFHSFRLGVTWTF
ncbi:MAG: hypothetical protein AB7O97_07210 [Planctomycetota bacterium]